MTRVNLMLYRRCAAEVAKFYELFACADLLTAVRVCGGGFPNLRLKEMLEQGHGAHGLTSRGSAAESVSASSPLRRRRRESRKSGTKSRQ